MEKMMPGAVSRTLACDTIELAIAMDASGERSILMRPIRSGEPVSETLAISRREAHRLAAELVHMVQRLDAPHH